MGDYDVKDRWQSFCDGFLYAMEEYNVGSFRLKVGDMKEEFKKTIEETK